MNPNNHCIYVCANISHNICSIIHVYNNILTFSHLTLKYIILSRPRAPLWLEEPCMLLDTVAYT